MFRFKKLSKTRRRVPWRQAFSAVVAVGLVLAVGLVATDQYKAMQERAVDAAPSDAETFSGSILFMSEAGQTCHQLLFDNHTGHFTDNGYVDCARAAYQDTDTKSEELSASRAQGIASGFH